MVGDCIEASAAEAAVMVDVELSLRGEDLADGTQMISGVGGRGEGAGGGDIIPGGAGGDGVLPFLDFVAKGGAEFLPLIVGDGGALPAGVPVCAGEGVFFAGGPAVEEREAEMQVIDVGGDGGFAGHGAGGGGAGVDGIELAEEAGIAGVEEIGLAAGGAVEDFGEEAGEGALEDGVGHAFTFLLGHALQTQKLVEKLRPSSSTSAGTKLKPACVAGLPKTFKRVPKCTRISGMLRLWDSLRANEHIGTCRAEWLCFIPVEVPTAVPTRNRPRLFGLQALGNESWGTVSRVQAGNFWDGTGKAEFERWESGR
jgi:hypothetical protein